MRKEVIDSIRENKIIVIVRGVGQDQLIPLGEAMYKGGIRLMEITYNSSDPAGDELTARNIAMLCEHFKGRMLIGAGTVITEKQAELTKNAGGLFIISPDTNAAVIRRTRELDMVSIPGALTPSEVGEAHRAGADYVKLFPITSMGPEYVKAIKAPLSHISFLAVGGVNADNMRAYLDVGISGFGIGANIVDKKLLASGDYDGIARLAAEYVSKVK